MPEGIQESSAKKIETSLMRSYLKGNQVLETMKIGSGGLTLIKGLPDLVSGR
ncbi:hypothetical protein DOT_3319 [Desulfosporosinus sp. OT]|nr:hypothetical protein DOT_3319 [Desulfosporosinus sp. OT]